MCSIIRLSSTLIADYIKRNIVLRSFLDLIQNVGQKRYEKETTNYPFTFVWDNNR